MRFSRVARCVTNRVTEHNAMYSGPITGYMSGLILGLHPAYERRRYKVTPSLIGWTQT